MCIKPSSVSVFVLLIAIFAFILAVYPIPLPSSHSSISTHIRTGSQFGVHDLQSIVYRGKLHHDGPHPSAKCQEKWKSTLRNTYKASLVLTVDLHGCGNFSSVQSAIDTVPEFSISTTLIIVDSGTYREKVTIYQNKTNVLMQGGGYGNTFIEWNDTSLSSNGTNNSFSVAVFAANFTAYNISFKNTAPQESGQAVALLITGDQAAFYGCGFYGAQDTLFDAKGRHFFKECFIQGSVDFIFGSGKSLYLGCTINSIAKVGTSGIGGFITAQGRNSEDENSGFSFVNCKIDGTGKVLLGRAWKDYSTVVFSKTYMPSIILPEGWDDFRQPYRQKTAFFGEFACYGSGANHSKRVSYAKQLKESEAASFMNISYIDGEQWLHCNNKCL